jgi:hypothetical protein
VRLFFAHRPSPAMVVACIALLVALGGTSYAIQALPQNSVGTQQLKNNAVASKKIQNGAVNSNKVKNGSLLRADFKAGQLPGATNVTVVTSGPPNGFGVVNPVATCPAGQVATGGGGVVGGGPTDLPPDTTWYLYASHPVLPAGGGPPTAWTVSAADTGPPAGPSQPAIAYVVCAAP